MRTAPLNIFQQTQRVWDQLHPYNAAQAMQMAGRFPAADIADAFNFAIRDLRLGIFAVSGNRYRIEPDPSAASLLESTSALSDLLRDEMNRPFDARRSFPFRPFVCEESGRQTIGLIYQHWPADSVSIRMLMRQWLMRILGETQPVEPVTLPDGGLARYFGPGVAGWSVLPQACDILSFAARMKRIRRIETRSDQTTVDVQLSLLPPGLIHPVKARARREGFTVGDVFLAALAEACAAHGPTVATRRRPGMALGTIVDLRSRAARVPRSVFGLFLGFTTSTFGPRDLGSFDALLRASRRQRRAAQSRRSAEGSQLNMAIGLAVARWFGVGKRLSEFYRKRFPLSGGISNVNLTPEWPGRHLEAVEVYHRTSPTGPMMPLVVTPTTLGDRVSLCCTVRSASMDRPQTRALLRTLESCLVRYAG